MRAGKNCMSRWPTKSQSFRECFSGCYGNLFIFLPNFSILTTEYDIHSLWNDDVVRTKPVMLTWRTIKEEATFGSIAEVNKAMFRESSGFEIFFSKLKRYTDKHGVVLPGEGIGQGILDPFLIADLMRILRKNGKASVVLSAHGYVDRYELDRDLAPTDVRLIEGQYYPTMLYTEDLTLLCKSEQDYCCGLIASTEKYLLEAVIEQANLEGFFPRDRIGLDWDVPDHEIRSPKGAGSK